MMDGDATSPAYQRTARRRNLALVLGMVREHGLLSRTDLAGLSGLNKVTISSLTADLVSRGLLREAGARTTGRAGRPARMLELDGTAIATAAAEINVDQVSLYVADLTGHQLLSRAAPMPSRHPSPRRAVSALVGLLKKAERELTRKGVSVQGLRVGVPAMIDVKAGIVTYAPHLGWHDIPLAEMVKNALGRPGFDVGLDRLARFAAYAELHFGGWTRQDNILLLYGDVGVGGAHIIDGVPLRGNQGLACEFGHLPLDPRGPLCDCGRRGCLEAFVGLGPLSRAALAAGLDAEWAHSPLTSLSLESAADDMLARPAIRRELRRQGVWLARGAAAAVYILNPGVIVLGGYFPRLAPFMWQPFEEELRARTLPAHLATCRIAVSELGADAPMRGGAALLADQLLADPLRIPHSSR